MNVTINKTEGYQKKPIKHLNKWVEALTGGEYVQGNTFLEKDGRFCCLGVYADLFL